MMWYGHNPDPAEAWCQLAETEASNRGVTCERGFLGVRLSIRFRGGLLRAWVWPGFGDVRATIAAMAG